MTRFILNPDPAAKKTWGLLAHVSESERQEILDLPSGHFKPAVKQLERDFKAFQKDEKKRAEAKLVSGTKA